MSNIQKGFQWIRFLSFVFVVGLFVADIGLDALAKPVPVWAYAIPGLLALGIEAPAVARLAMQAIRSFARIPHEGDGK